MTSTQYAGMAQLIANDPVQDGASPPGIVRDAAVAVDERRVAWLGAARDAPDADRRTHLCDLCVLPGFGDSHGHFVSPRDRTEQFAARIPGRAPRRRSGSTPPSAPVRAAADDELASTARQLRTEMRRRSTNTVAIAAEIQQEI